MCFCTHSNITFTYYIRSQQWGFYVLFSAKILTCSMTMFLKFVCKNMCFCTHSNMYVCITSTYYMYAASHEDFMYFSVQKSLLAVWQCSWDMYVFCVLNQVKAFCLCIQIVTPEYVFHHVGSYDTLYRAYLQISHLCWLPFNSCLSSVHRDDGFSTVGTFYCKYKALIVIVSPLKITS